MDENGASRRELLAGLGTAVTTVSLAGCSGNPEIQGPEPTATPSQITSTLQTTATPQTWDPLEEYLTLQFDSDADIGEVTVEIADTSGNSTETAVTEHGDTVQFADSYRPQTAGSYTLTVTAEHGDQTSNWTTDITVKWKIPEDALFGDQLRKLLDTLDDDAAFMDSLTTTAGYTEAGRAIAIFFIELMNTDESLAKSLAPAVSTYDQQATDGDVEFLKAVQESQEQYRTNLVKFGLTESEDFDGIRTFETELYGLDGVLGGRTQFGDDEDRTAVRDSLLSDFRSMRDNILFEKGYFEQEDISYLRLVADLIAERKIARNPRYERLKTEEQWVAPTADGQITTEAIERLETARDAWERTSANDLIADPIKTYALEIDPEKDVVLMEVGYTEAVSYRQQKQLITDVIDYMAREYDIYIVAIEGATDKETFSGVSDWLSSTSDRASELDKLGMHQLYFDEEALPDAAGKARLGRSVSRGIVETKHRVGYVDYALKHEMGHMFGLWSDKYGWVHAGCNSDQADSYMTYCSDLPTEKFTEKDLNAMREQQFEQDNMSMTRLEQFVIDGRTLYDEFETIYTPKSLSVPS